MRALYTPQYIKSGHTQYSAGSIMKSGSRHGVHMERKIYIVSLTKTKEKNKMVFLHVNHSVTLVNLFW